MIYSMTGYGKGSAEYDDHLITAEVKTVNHRFLEISSRLPKSLAGHEGEVEKIVRKRLKRGHVYVSISVDRGAENQSVAINMELLSNIYKELKAFAVREGIPGQIDMNTLLSFPDIIFSGEEEVRSSKLWAAAKKALNAALRECVQMRINEGEELAAGVNKRIDRLSRIVGRIEKKSPALKRKAFERAKLRVERLLEGTAELDDGRWAVEVALMAEKSDVTEEIARLKSHLNQFRDVMKKGGEVSKKLTFLLQEIHREATTMGNKSVNGEIVKSCMEIKEEAEKIREQVQNFE
ncbi:YicC family protein [bacterium]|nr:MAG: YicC family protein [bacterium]